MRARVSSVQPCHDADSISMYPESHLGGRNVTKNLILVLAAIELLVASPLVSADNGYEKYVKETHAISNLLVRMVKTEFNYQRHFHVKGLYLAHQGFVLQMNVKNLLPVLQQGSHSMSEAARQASDVRTRLAAQMQELQAEDRRAVSAARQASNDDDRKRLQSRIAEVETQLAHVRQQWIAASREVSAQVRKSEVQRRKALQKAQQPEVAKIAEKMMAWLCEHPPALRDIPETEHLSIVLDGVRGIQVVSVMTVGDVIHCKGDSSGLIDRAITYTFK